MYFPPFWNKVYYTSRDFIYDLEDQRTPLNIQLAGVFLPGCTFVFCVSVFIPRFFQLMVRATESNAMRTPRVSSLGLKYLVCACVKVAGWAMDDHAMVRNIKTFSFSCLHQGSFWGTAGEKT